MQSETVEETSAPIEATTSSDPASDLKEILRGVADQLHSEFVGPGAVSRLEQFDAHMSTLLMVIDHLYDEAGRMTGPKGEDIYRSEVQG